MKRFLLKTTLFLALLVMAALVVAVATAKLAYPKLSKRGRGVVIDKNNRLDAIQGPKIILIGGSNVCYGTDSRLIEDSLNMPVVDMSINAKMGMKFYCEQVKHAIKQGDIVVSIPEYAVYNGKDLNGNEGTYSLCLIDRRNIKYISCEQWLRLPLFLGDIIQDNFTALASSSEKNKITNGRFEYNEYGDYEGHRNDSSHSYSFAKKQEHYLANILTEDGVDDSYAALATSFSSFCQQQKAVYLQAYPVYAKVFFDSVKVKAIRQKLPDLQWIGDPAEFLYDMDQLYDSPNHLVYTMKKERTLKLIKDIRQGLIKAKNG